MDLLQIDQSDIWILGRFTTDLYAFLDILSQDQTTELCMV